MPSLRSVKFFRGCFRTDAVFHKLLDTAENTTSSPLESRCVPAVRQPGILLKPEWEGAFTFVSLSAGGQGLDTGKV